MAVLDTSFLIDILRNKKEAVGLRVELEREGHLFAAAPTVYELWQGALQSRLPWQEKSKVDGILSSVSVLDLDARSSKRAAEIAVELSRKGESIETEDLMIAGIALSNGEMVVTRDPHFSRIPGLKVLKYS